MLVVILTKLGEAGKELAERMIPFPCFFTGFALGNFSISVNKAWIVLVTSNYLVILGRLTSTLKKKKRDEIYIAP